MIELARILRRPRAASSAVVLSALISLLVGGCVRAPAVTVVSAHTALERQAAGEYPVEERALADASISPAPAPIPREQLTAGGQASGLGVVDEMVARAESDQERIDQLLVARCIGEAQSGLIEVTAETCSEQVDPNEVARLVGRVNVHRRQVWTYVAERNPGTTEDQARDRWRALHMQRIVCGGQIASASGGWETKRCAD